MKKVLLVATVQSHICQFHKPLISLLKSHGVEVHVAARDNLAEKNGLKLEGADKVFNVPFSRSPFSLKNLKAYRQLKKIIKAENYDVIHCNTPVSGVLTRIAAKKARKKGTKVFYTAHGFHFYHGAPKKNWLIWYPIEKHFAKRTDTLITINNEDYELASKKFKTNVVHVHGVGVSEGKYHTVDKDENLKMREKEGLSEKDFVILCTGELNKNKNQRVLISAVAEIKEKIPNVKLLLAGNGPKDAELKEQVKALGLEKEVRFLGYRTDLDKVVPVADVIASCSLREGLPCNIVEAMLAKKTVVASKNRGHSELIEDKVSGFICDPENPHEFANAILSAYNKECENMGEKAHDASSAYVEENVIKELKEVYGLK